MANQLTQNYLISDYLTTYGIRDFLPKNFKVKFGLDGVKKIYLSYFRRLIGRDSKDGCVKIAFQQWDSVTQEKLGVTILKIPDDMRGELLSLSGNIRCGKKTRMFLSDLYKFTFENPLDSGILDFSGTLTGDHIFHPPLEDGRDHDQRCRYRREDLDGSISSWSSFILRDG